MKNYKAVILRVVATTAITFLLTSAVVQAGPILQGGTEGTTTGFYAENFMQGYTFNTTTDLSLTALGFWDSNSDGLIRNYQVGLWNTGTQTLLTSALINSSSMLDNTNIVAGGAWRYESVGPIALTTAVNYTLAWQVGSIIETATDSLLLSYGSLVSDSDVSLVLQNQFLDTSSFTFPTNSNSLSNQFRGNVNALVQPHTPAVPEPSTILLLSTGLLSLASYRWSQRQREGTQVG